MNLVTGKKAESRLSIMGWLRVCMYFAKFIMESLREGPKAEKLCPR